MFSGRYCFLIQKKVLLVSTILLSNLAFSQADPLEPFNRVVFRFNDTLDQILVLPATRIYQKVTPQFLENRVNNFFENLDGVSSILNSFAQAKFKKGMRHTGQFTINTTLGVLGLFDVAVRFGFDEDPEDFGQTLAVWRVPQGPYLVLPIYGPSTLRDSFGRITDQFTYPITYVPEQIEPRVAIYGLDLVSTRADLLKYESILTGDRYQVMKDLYLQSRQYEILDGDVIDEFTADSDVDDGEFLDESF